VFLLPDWQLGFSLRLFVVNFLQSLILEFVMVGGKDHKFDGKVVEEYPASALKIPDNKYAFDGKTYLMSRWPLKKFTLLYWLKMDPSIQQGEYWMEVSRV